MPKNPFPSEKNTPKGGLINPHGYLPTRVIDLNTVSPYAVPLAVGPNADGDDNRSPEPPGVNYSTNVPRTDNSSPPSSGGTLRQMQKG